MYRYFFHITLRNLTKQGVFTIINILGLSIGLAVVLLISLFNFNELSFDRSFKESRNIYRVNSKMRVMRSGETSPMTSNAVAPAMQAEIPEVIAAVRIKRESYQIGIDDEQMRTRVCWVDDDFFQLFNTPFIYGTPEDVMTRPNAIALSEGEAKKMFGDQNPIGKTLLLNVEFRMEVVAVYKDYPENSSFTEFVTVAPSKYSWPAFFRNERWDDISFVTFCLLHEKADVASVHTKMQKMLSDATGGRWDAEGLYDLQLQRLDKIHLHSSDFYMPTTTYMSSLSDVKKVKTLTLLAVIILLVACINYMNLSTARAQKRSKEIGISKTIGAKRYELMLRLTLETAIYTLVSFAVEFMLARLLLPVFNDLSGEHLNFKFALQPAFLGVALLIWFITTLLAASYPVMYMSGFPPLMAIRSQHIPGSSHANIRKILTVGQFVIAIVLISWVLVIQNQIMFANKKDLGYNQHNMIAFWVPEITEAILNDIRAESSVEMATRETSSLIGRMNTTPLFKNTDDKIGLGMIQVGADPEFIDLMQIKLIAGRLLPEQQRGDTIIRILLNRTAVNYLEMTPEEVVGKRVSTGLARYTEVYGVVENFHFESLHHSVGGLCIHNSPYLQKQMIRVRVKEGLKISNYIDTYERIQQKHFPNRRFEPWFLEDNVAKLYDSDKRTGRLAIVFSVLAIVVACMGVFGLTAFMAEQRTKEIGIRKVMGATIWNIVNLFTGNYVKLLGISLVIATPIAWWVADRYLQNFAYRISLPWWIFAAAALITVALTLLTVSVLALKAATANPVKAIKSE